MNATRSYTVLCAIAAAVVTGPAYAATLKVNFTVNFPSGPELFQGSLTSTKGQLSGNVFSPSGCPGSVDSGSTDIKNKLDLHVTFNGFDCANQASSFVGTLNFKTGTGAGTFTGPFSSAPYTATHG